MKLIKFFAMAMSVAGVVTLSSCLDYEPRTGRIYWRAATYPGRKD